MEDVMSKLREENRYLRFDRNRWLVISHVAIVLAIGLSFYAEFKQPTQAATSESQVGRPGGGIPRQPGGGLPQYQPGGGLPPPTGASSWWTEEPWAHPSLPNADNPPSAPPSANNPPSGRAKTPQPGPADQPPGPADNKTSKPVLIQPRN